jgi:hypothetical protein
MGVAMTSEENPGVPVGYLLNEIAAGDNGLISCWVSPDGKDHVGTFDDPIREGIARFARRHGIIFDTATRALAEAGFDWMRH